MGLFSKLFSKPEKSPVTAQGPLQMSFECKQLIELSNLIKKITSGDHFVARSEYRKKADEYAKVVEHFTVLKNSGMLGEYCAKNGIQKYVRLEEGIALYSIGRTKFREIAKEAHAIRSIGRVVLYDTEKLNEYIDSFEV